MSQPDPLSPQPPLNDVHQIAADAEIAAQRAAADATSDTFANLKPVTEALRSDQAAPVVTPPATPSFVAPAPFQAPAPAPAPFQPPAPAPFQAPFQAPAPAPAPAPYQAPVPAPAPAPAPYPAAPAAPAWGAPPAQAQFPPAAAAPVWGAPQAQAQFPPAAPAPAPAYGATPAAPWGTAAAAPQPQPYPTGYAMQGPPGFPPPVPKKKNTGLIIGIIVLVVLIIAALVGFHFFSGNSNNPNAPVSPGQAKTADAAVRGYLEALAAGSSADALAFIDTPPTNTSMLTDDVLAYSNSINPISNITTDNSTGYSVDATFDIGSETFTSTFYTQQDGKYYKLLSTAVSSMYVPSLPTGLSMTINGATPTVANFGVPLFPGYYEAAVDNSLVTVINGNFYVSGIISSSSPDTMSLDLSSDAQSQFQDAAAAQLDSCMAEQSLKTSCGFGPEAYDKSGTPVDVDTSSIEWSFNNGSSDDFSDADFEWTFSDELSATAYYEIDLTVDLSSTNGHAYYKDVYLSETTIDFSDPSNLVVSFS